MVPHCCFAIALLLVPLAYVMSQIITFLAFDGRWRLWTLAPFVVFAITLATLLAEEIVGAFFAVILAGAAGLVAVALVWAAWRSSVRERDATNLS
jgi:L-lactate permease